MKELCIRIIKTFFNFDEIRRFLRMLENKMSNIEKKIKSGSKTYNF